MNLQNPNEQQQYNPYARYNPSDYEDREISEKYGSIIKDLTDTDIMLLKLEARLRGKIIKTNTLELVDDPDMEAYIKSDRAARDLMDIVRSKVNRHVDFSFYDDKEANDRILGAAALINRWLMFQGGDVPLRYRFKIADMCLSLIDASYHKATDGKMLKWTKGTFREGMNISQGPEKKGLWETIWPFGKKAS